MKKINVTLVILALMVNSTVFGEMAERLVNPYSAERIATNLIHEFDSDQSAALNKLELSGAIEFLSLARPYLLDYLDFESTGEAHSAPPKIAFGLVEGFDSNSDYQLTREELSLAINYLRRLNRTGFNTVAMTE